MAAIECRILGPFEVFRDGRRVSMPPRQRALLALLLLRPGETVAVGELLDALWHDEPPPSAKASLQNAVSSLRRLLGENVVRTSPPGYGVAVEAVQLDAHRFESLLALARSAEPAERAALLREALACWRGTPLSDLDVAWSEIARLDELRLGALEDRIDADLALGAGAELVSELEALIRRDPLRERLWAQLMRTLYHAGRQAEALATYRRAHDAFSEGLGIEPGPALKELQLAILVHDRGLEDEHGSGVTDLLSRAAPLLPTRTFSERAQSLLDYSVALWRLGERSRATAVLENAKDAAGRGRNESLSELIGVMLAQHALVRGELAVSQFLQHVENAVSAMSSLDDDRLLAKALTLHGVALRNAGRAADAAAIVERAIVLAKSASDPWQEGWARNQLGITLTVGPTPVADALQACEEHLAALEWGPPGPIGLWASMGWLHAALGARAEAGLLGAKAVDGARDAGLRIELAWARAWLADAVDLSDPARAETELRSAHELLAATEDDESMLPSVRSNLARYAARRGALEEADALLAASRGQLRGDDVNHQVSYHRAAAMLEARRGHLASARELAQTAAAFASTSDNIDLRACVLEDLGRIDPTSSALADAERLYAEKGNIAALARLRELG